MKALDRLLYRPLEGCLQGVLIGIFLSLAPATRLADRTGREWAIALTPVWLGLMVLTIPLGIICSLPMTVLKGPCWQYPSEVRGSGRTAWDS